MSDELEKSKTQTAADRVAKLEADRYALQFSLANCEREIKTFAERDLFNGCWITSDGRQVVIVVEGNVDVHNVDDGTDDTRD